MHGCAPWHLLPRCVQESGRVCVSNNNRLHNRVPRIHFSLFPSFYAVVFSAEESSHRLQAREDRRQV